jgi:hypothetical protein
MYARPSGKKAHSLLPVYEEKEKREGNKEGEPLTPSSGGEIKRECETARESLPPAR